MSAILVGTLLLLAAASPAEEAAALDAELLHAARSYNAERALTVLNRARELDCTRPDPGTGALRLRAALAVAELLRIEFEQTPRSETAVRAAFGRRIDVAAEEGLALLGRLPEDSERHRLEADLVATLIRSDFRATRHEARFRTAVDRALALDPRNPRAHLAAAKPLVFAPPERGRDLRAAVARLTTALDLDPALEPARLLRALALGELGDDEAARRDWQAALAANPDCLPARKALASAREGVSR